MEWRSAVMKSFAIVLSIIVFVISHTSVSAQDIDTTPTPQIPGAYFLVDDFGRDYSLWGEIFQIREEHYLQGFSFLLGDTKADFSFVPYLAAFSSDGRIDQIIWQGATANRVAGEDESWETFDLGGIYLPAGHVYFAFMHAPLGGGIGEQAIPFYYGGVENGYSRLNPTGKWVTSRAGAYYSDPLEYTSFRFDRVGYDAAFRADFSAEQAAVTPEPFTTTLVGSGLLAVAGTYGRRRRRE
jgi:hypothetical protein